MTSPIKFSDMYSYYSETHLGLSRLKAMPMLHYSKERNKRDLQTSIKKKKKTYKLHINPKLFLEEKYID